MMVSCVGGCIFDVTFFFHVFKCKKLLRVPPNSRLIRVADERNLIDQLLTNRCATVRIVQSAKFLRMVS